MKHTKRLFAVLLAMVMLMCAVPIIHASAQSYASDYRKWSQGGSDYSAVRSYGCWIVAMSKLIYEANIDRSASFNPDAFAVWEVNNGRIASLSSVGQKGDGGQAPLIYAQQKGKDLTYFGNNWDNSDGQIMWNTVTAGYYTIVNVYNSDGSPHYVMIDNEKTKATGQLYCYDSFYDRGSVDSQPLSRYPSRGNIYVYKANNPVVNSHDPLGKVEGCTGGPACVFMDGWVFDRDNLSATVDLRVYIGGDAGSGEYHLVHTGYSRPDINATYGCGNNHGIYTTVPTKKTGTQDVYVYAVNIGSGSDVLLGKFSVTMKPGFALEMNGRVNGSSVSNLSGYGTVDFYVDGELIGNDITDISASTGRFAWGAKYEIKDIKAKSGYAYNGVYSGSLTGTFMDGVNLTVVLDFISSSSTLKIDPNGGTWNGSAAVQTFKQNSYTTKSIPVPTRSGYTFAGWTRSGTNGTLSSTTGAATYTFGPTNNATDTIKATWKCSHAATTLINQKAASYDAEGYSGDTYCTVCNQTISYGHTLPKLDPSAPDQPQQSDVCKWCGQEHGGIFGWLIQLIHNLLAMLFGAKY